MRSQPAISTNNPLHIAIINRENAQALELIATIPTSELNHKSLGNTPLMLALKTANFEVALAILQRKDAAVVSLLEHDQSGDERGVTPLQLACAWRQPSIILAVLDHYKTYLSNLFECEIDIKNLFHPESTTADMWKLRLKFTPTLWPGVNPMLKSMLTKRNTANIYHRNDDPENILHDIQFYKYDQHIKDGAGLVILTAPELTDALLFHTKLICLNLGLKKADDFKELPSTYYQFASDLNIGWRAIIDWRNSQQIDERVVEIIGQPTSPTVQASVKKNV